MSAAGERIAQAVAKALGTDLKHYMAATKELAIAAVDDVFEVEQAKLLDVCSMCAVYLDEAAKLLEHAGLRGVAGICREQAERARATIQTGEEA